MSSKNYQTAAFASLCLLLGCSSETGLGIADLPPGPGSAPAASQPGGQPTQLTPPPPGLPPSVLNPPPPQQPKPAVCQVDLRRTSSPRGDAGGVSQDAAGALGAVRRAGAGG